MTDTVRYPKNCFIQLGFADMPSYAPVESIWNDPIEMYGNFISDTREVLEADILDTQEEYQLQIKAGEREEGDAPDPERVTACTLFADASIQIGDRVITLKEMGQFYVQITPPNGSILHAGLHRCLLNVFYIYFHYVSLLMS